MEKDRTTIQWLNLLHSSPTFAIRVGNDDESANVLPLKSIPGNDGEYWVFGETRLQNRRSIPSVFRVDTNSGGNFIGVYWKIANNWWDFQDRPDVMRALGVTEHEAFPFDWVYAIPLQNDIFHS